MEIKCCGVTLANSAHFTNQGKDRVKLSVPPVLRIIHGTSALRQLHTYVLVAWVATLCKFALIYKNAWRRIPDDNNLHSYYSKNLKFTFTFPCAVAI